jgi:hypothetical protein
VTVCQFLHFHTLMFESRASHVIDSRGVAQVLTDKTNKLGKRQFVKRRENVPYVLNSYRIKDMNVSNHSYDLSAE